MLKKYLINRCRNILVVMNKTQKDSCCHCKTVRRFPIIAYIGLIFAVVTSPGIYLPTAALGSEPYDEDAQLSQQYAAPNKSHKLQRRSSTSDNNLFGGDHRLNNLNVYPASSTPVDSNGSSFFDNKSRQVASAAAAAAAAQLAMMPNNARGGNGAQHHHPPYWMQRRHLVDGDESMRTFDIPTPDYSTMQSVRTVIHHHQVMAGRAARVLDMPAGLY
jgi:hypothetical protein